MSNTTRNRIIHLASICSLILGIIFALAIILGAVALSTAVPGFNLAKLIMVDFVLLIVAVAVFLLFFGIYEFFISIKVIEKEVQELEQDMEEVEANNQKKGM